MEREDRAIYTITITSPLCISGLFVFFPYFCFPIKSDDAKIQNKRNSLKLLTQIFFLFLKKNKQKNKKPSKLYSLS